MTSATGESARGGRRWGLRSRVGRLYGSRRHRLLLVPRGALERRYGAGRIEADDDNRWLRVRDGEATVEVGFAGTFRMFGALFDTQWVARLGSVDPGAARYEYRFDKKRFVARAGAGEARAAVLTDDTVRRLAGRSEIKRLTVLDGRAGTQVELVPLAGTITAVYFPPMPPYTVVLKDAEADDHLALVLHLLSLA